MKYSFPKQDSHVERVLHDGRVPTTEEMTIARDIAGAGSNRTRMRRVEQRQGAV
jgi:hypothetical protein